MAYLLGKLTVIQKRFGHQTAPSPNLQVHLACLSNWPCPRHRGWQLTGSFDINKQAPSDRPREQGCDYNIRRRLSLHSHHSVHSVLASIARRQGRKAHLARRRPLHPIHWNSSDLFHHLRFRGSPIFQSYFGKLDNLSLHGSHHGNDCGRHYHRFRTDATDHTQRPKD